MPTKNIRSTDERKPAIILFDIELDDAGLDPYTYRIYGRMVRRCSGQTNGQCFETIHSIATACKMSEASVKRAIAEMLRARMIRKVVQSKGRTYSVYALLDKSEWRLDQLKRANGNQYQPALTEPVLQEPVPTELSRASQPVLTDPPTGSHRATEENKEENTKEEKREKSAPRPSALSLCDSSFLEEMAQKYPHFDTEHVYAKFLAHCEEKGWKPTKARGRDWFKRERPDPSRQQRPVIVTVEELKKSNVNKHADCKLCNGLLWESVPGKGARPCPGP
jgi:hypothetical protein